MNCSSDGEEDEDDEGISEHSLKRSASDDGKADVLSADDKTWNCLKNILASQDSDYCTEDFNLLNETDVW